MAKTNKQTRSNKMKYMKDYTIEVIELHEVKKTYYVSALNKKDAKNKAKVSDWDDANQDDFTGNINKVIVKTITQD